MEAPKVDLAIKGDVKRLQLAMGDKLVVCFNERLPRNHVFDVKDQLQALFPRNEVLVLAGVEAVGIIPAAGGPMQRV